MKRHIVKRVKKTTLIELILVACFLLVACSNTLPTTPTPGQTTLTTVPATVIKADGKTLNMTLELARTDKEQETGLMGRTSLQDGNGMLFVFKQPGNINFWMKDTKLPLSIAFIDTTGKILEIQDMQPFSEDLHTSSQPYQYALEVEQGWFKKADINSGDKISFNLQ